MKKILNHIKNNRIIIILMFLLYVSSICFWYDDTNSNIIHSINIWKSMFSGDFFHYYSYNIESYHLGLTSHKGGYEVFLYLFVSIWQFPLFIIEKFLGGNIIDYFFARAWAKLFFILMIYLCYIQIKKICNNLRMPERTTFIISVLFCASSFLITSACVVSQIDIVGLLFILLSFNCFIQKKEKQFVLWFTFATLCKAFALFIFIPLILLKEKRIIKVAVMSLLPVIVMYILNLPFSLLDPEGVLCKIEPTSGLIQGLLLSTISIFGRPLPLIFLGYAGLGIYCYLKDVSDEKEEVRLYWYAYIAAVASLIFTLMVESPYRNIYIVPFYMIAFFYNKDNQRRRLLVLTIANLAMTIALLIRFPYCSDYQFMKNMLIDCILPLRKFELMGLEQISSYMLSPNMNDLWLFLYAIFVMWSIGFCVVNRPDKVFNSTNRKEKCLEKITNKDLLIYAGVNYVVCNISVLLFVVMVIRNIILKFI